MMAATLSKRCISSCFLPSNLWRFSSHRQLKYALFINTSLLRSRASYQSQRQLAMASTNILSQTLSNITDIKLDEISTQRSAFEAIKSKILEETTRQTNQREKVIDLVKGLEQIHSLTKPGSSSLTFLDNVKRFLDQAHRDPSVSTELQKDWEKEIKDLLDIQSLKWEYATLYGKLVGEWLNAGKDQDDLSSSGDASSSSFENVGRNEMHEQRATWERYVFKPLNTDTVAISKYLDQLFTSSKPVKAALETLKKETKGFESLLKNTTHFDHNSLTWVINGLLRSDLLSDEKKALLKDFLNNKVVLTEISDVLNMRISSLDKWCWDPAGTPVEQRRQLNGRYRFYHDEDLLQTILLRYIGVKWSVFFKGALGRFQGGEEVWKASAKSVPVADQKRREHFLGSFSTAGGVETARSKHFRNEIFLEQLADEGEEMRGGYDDDSESPKDTRKSGQQITQGLLHTLASEIIMKTRLGEEITVVRTDFKWFGPSLPHSTMFAVLSFFGVSEKWISFFRRAIEAPMKFVQDGSDAPVQTRKRGTPISGPLSDMLGETVLFCLDFSFNQQTNGARMYRLHDDIWFWGEETSCVDGWKVMKNFASLTGLEYNDDKTGSVKIVRKGEETPKVSTSLPKGDVRWGFLKLDAKTGRFLIDETSVESHVKELRLQLNACKSVFDYIQAWNVYGSRFFANNFGRPAYCYGLEHVDMLLETHSSIQQQLFEGSSITATLKKMISERFGVDDIPEGYLYFPMALGGLDLKNPFVDLYLIRDRFITQSPDSFMDKFFEEEEQNYRRCKTRYEKGELNRHRFAPHGEQQFMDFEEFTRYREQTSPYLNSAYTQLLREPVDDPVESSHLLYRTRSVGSIMTSAQEWLIQLYGKNMKERFGGLDIVEQGLLPTGMVTMFRESRFKWQG